MAKSYSDTMAQTMANLQMMSEGNVQSEGASGMDSALAEIFGSLEDNSIPETKKKEAKEKVEKTIKKEIEDGKKEGIEFIDVDKLIPNKFNYFSINEEDDSFKAIKNSIKEMGFMKGLAITGEKLKNGKVAIVSGHTRVKIAKILEIKEVPITYEEFKSDFDRFHAVIASNHYRQRKVSDVLNNYKAAEKFYDEKRCGSYEGAEQMAKQEFISHILGVSSSTIHNLMFLLKMPPNIWKAIDMGLVTTDNMRAVYKQQKIKPEKYDVLIKSLSTDERLYSKELDKSEKENIIKEYFAEFNKKTRTAKEKTCKTELDKIAKTIDKLVANESIKRPETETEKAELRQVIAQVEIALAKLNDIAKGN